MKGGEEWVRMILILVTIISSHWEVAGGRGREGGEKSVEAVILVGKSVESIGGTHVAEGMLKV